MQSQRSGRDGVLARYRSLLRVPHLGGYYSGQFVSWLGDWVNTVALLALTFRLTRSTSGVVLVFVATQLPNIVLPVIAGALVDRWDRKRLLLLCDGIRVPLSALLVIAAVEHSLPLVYVITFLSMSLSVLYNLAKAAMLPTIVNRRQLLTANSLAFALYSLATVLGGALGGTLVATLGEAAAFGFNGFTYVVSGITILLLAVPPPLPLERPRAGAHANFRSLISGLDVLRADGYLLSITLLVMAVFFASGALQVLFPLTASHVMPWGRSGVGYLYAALGIGSVAGALLTADLGYRYGRTRIFAIGLVIAGVSLAIFGLAGAPAALLFSVGAYGLAIVTAQSTAATAVQERTPPAFLGRVFGLRQLLIGISTLAGSTIAGLVVRGAGRGGTLVAVAIVVTLAGLGRLVYKTKPKPEFAPTLEAAAGD